MLQDVQAHGGRAVAELGFKPDEGVWHYKVLRTDKRDGNFVTTLMDALLQLAEGISEQEMRYRVAKTSDKDQWGRQIEASRDDILARGRRGGGGGISGAGGGGR